MGWNPKRAGWYLLRDGRTPFYGTIPEGATEIDAPSAAGDEPVDAGDGSGEVDAVTLGDEGVADGDELGEGDGAAIDAEGEFDRVFNGHED